MSVVLLLASFLSHHCLKAQDWSASARIELRYVEYQADAPWQESLRVEHRQAVYLGQGRFLFAFQRPAEWLRTVSVSRPGVSEIVANYKDHDSLLGLVLAQVDARAQKRLERSGLKKIQLSSGGFRVQTLSTKRLSLTYGESKSAIAQSSGSLLFERGLVPYFKVDAVLASLPEGALLWEQKKFLGFTKQFSRPGKSLAVLHPAYLEYFLANVGKKHTPSFIRWPLRYTRGLHTQLSISGLRYHPVLGKAARRYYRLGEHERAVFVDSLSPFLRGYSELREGDLILSVDGIPLLEDGRLADPNLGKIPLSAYLSMQKGRPASSKAVYRLRIKRANLRKSVKHRPLSLSVHDFLVPDYLRRPAFLIVGGVVLQELSRNYLRTSTNAPAYLKKLAQKRTLADPRGLRRIVVIDRILPLSLTRGYSYNKERLISVDGVVVRDLSHAKTLIEEAIRGGRDIVLGLRDGERIVLDAQGLAKANRLLQERYGLPFLERNLD